MHACLVQHASWSHYCFDLLSTTSALHLDSCTFCSQKTVTSFAMLHNLSACFSSV